MIKTVVLPQVLLQKKREAVVSGAVKFNDIKSLGTNILSQRVNAQFVVFWMANKINVVSTCIPGSQKAESV